MVHINSFITALKVSWIRRVIQQSDDAVWCAFSKIQFSKLLSVGSEYAENQAKLVQNPFWKDVLLSWANFCKKLKIETINSILYSPLWFNTNFINGKNLYINDWYNKGVRNINDILDENGNFYDFDILKERYGIRGTFLNYETLIHKIPNEWKTQIEVNNVIIFQNRYNVVSNIYVTYLTKEKKGSRTFYDVLENVNEINNHTKWVNELGNISEIDWKLYHSGIKQIKEVKLADFQFKVNNKILVTNSFLFKIKKIESNLCSYCKEHIETIDHLFLKCVKVKEFWNSLNIWLNEHCNISLYLEDRNIIFSMQPQGDIEDFLLCLAKYYIYKNKFTKNSLNIQSFIALLQSKFLSAKYIANIHNQFAKFMKKWLQIYNYFMNRPI